jgi:hypothetical protein
MKKEDCQYRRLSLIITGADGGNRKFLFFGFKALEKEDGVHGTPA